MQQLVRKATTAAIADILDQERQAPLARLGKNQPALDRMAAKTGKGDVEHLKQLQCGVRGRHVHGTARRPRLSQRLAPECRKIGRHGDGTLIGVESGMHEIGKGHGENQNLNGS
ncbi:hypothetical protein D3C87_1788510 [compost metagenome]